VAVVNNGFIYTSTDSGVNWTQRDSSRFWKSVASSSDGTNLVAVVNGSFIYTSTDSGVNWTQRDSSRNWSSVASSSDGTKLVAVANNGFGGYIYTSSNSGANWVQTSAPFQTWTSVASSLDGTKLVAVVNGGSIYTSSNSGGTWVQQTNAGSQNWSSVASNLDGTKLVAVVSGGSIYTSADSGVNWTQTSAPSQSWQSVASNLDGTKLVACYSVPGLAQGYIYTYAEPPPPLPCFKEGTKILTDQGYKAIEDLQKGDLIKTLKHGFLPVEILGKSEMVHQASNERIKDQLYKCGKENYPDVLEPLIITGCHSILVDWLCQEQFDKIMEDFGRIYETDGKPRLCAYIDERATVYETPGTYTIYHLALENEDYYGNYGIYANGLLVESCSKRYLLEHSNMKLLF